MQTHERADQDGQLIGNLLYECAIPHKISAGNQRLVQHSASVSAQEAQFVQQFLIQRECRRCHDLYTGPDVRSVHSVARLQYLKSS